jgi:tricorn protease
VVGIDGRYVLVDGTRTTQPKYAFWFDDGWAVENRGVAPDVEVPITPQDWAAGRDPQPETAIRLALDALARTPASTPPPPRSGRKPSRRKSPDMNRVGTVADNPYLRFPHLSGNLLTFVAEDDVWLAPLEAARADGARAWRLTADRTPPVNPRLNPSGTHVAWSAAREGAREAYAVEVDGGSVKRLTHWGSDGFENSGVRGWLSDTEVLVTGWHQHHAGMHMWPFAVPLDGPARELPYGSAADVSISPEGAVLVGTSTYREPAKWKRYGGGTGGKIWYSPDGTTYERILTEAGNHLVNPMWVSGRVTFMSDHEGAAAVYSALPDGTDVRRHTDHGAYYARHATTDGTRVVYQCAGDLWLLESLDAAPVKLNVQLGGVRSGRAPFPVSAKSALGDFALCKTGRIVTAEVRGTAHWLPVEQGPARAVLDRPGVRARIPLILPGAATVVCVSDSDGEDGLDIIPANGGESRRILSGGLGRVLELAASPDARTLAVASDDGRVLTVDVESGAAIELSRSAVAEVTGLTFSPDSALLAWTEGWAAAEESRHIRLARLADREIVDVTPKRFDDHSPVFTKDGKYLAFLSNRTFDPVYDAQLFDLGFLPGVRPYLVTLAADTPSPFAPELNGRPAKPEGKDGKKDKEKGEDAAEDAVEPVRLDLEGLAARVVPFPVQAGNYRALGAAEDSVLWLDVPRTGVLGESLVGAEDEHPKPALQSYDLAKRKLTTVVEALDGYAISGDGTRIAYRKDGELKVKAHDAKDDEDAITVDLDRIRVVVEPVAEWRQMYGENWRLLRDNFWRADMGGVDWDAIHARYLPLALRAGSADDLRDVLWEVGAELNTSHAYVHGPEGEHSSAHKQGHLGADLARGEDGVWRIARILPSETSVSLGRSPLEAPGVSAKAGDAVVAVDGRAVDPATGPAALLVGKADQPVELTLRRDGEQDRRVVVVPLSTEYGLRYYDLIRSRRAKVHELSGGRLGYIQVPDMMSQGWAEYHRDLHVEMGREGLVFDLRENGGGHTSQLVIEKLTRKVIGWDVSRRSEPTSYPVDAPRGPMVAITDEFAGSDGDIGTNAFKRYGLGPVVGQRTWGGVVGIDGKYTLVDGTGVTQPKYAFWFDNAGWAVENHGVDPDVEVTYAPHDYAAGHDPQLAEAVRLALEALEQHPAVTPPQIPEV